MSPKLTIGMATFDDYHGVYFSIQALRMYHPEVINDVEILVIDNNPEGPHGKVTKNLAGHWAGTKYVPFTEYQSTVVRNKIFEHASAPYVVSMDCHILFEKGSIKKLIDYYDQNPDSKDLLQGPLLYDDLRTISSHFDPVWRAQMFGIWANDKRANDPNGEPFEIPMQGLGVFSAKKENWLGFNSLFRGFGGEEGYIHEKYRKAGHKTLCLPFLRWVHRFGRPDGVKYPLTLHNKIRNYFLGSVELETDPGPIYEHFKEWMPEDKLKEIHEDALESSGKKMSLAEPMYDI